MTRRHVRGETGIKGWRYADDAQKCSKIINLDISSKSTRRRRRRRRRRPPPAPAGSTPGGCAFKAYF